MKPAPPVMRIRLPSKHAASVSTRYPSPRCAIAARRRAVCAAVVGCGAGAAAPGSPPAATDLKITVWPRGPRQRARRQDVHARAARPPRARCPRPPRACTQAAARCAAVRARPAGHRTAPTQYGGPQQALVTGTFTGARVWAHVLGDERLPDRACQARQPSCLPGFGTAGGCVRRRRGGAARAGRARAGGLRGQRGRSGGERGDRPEADALADRDQRRLDHLARSQCEPTGGDHPDPAAACAALTAVAGSVRAQLTPPAALQRDPRLRAPRSRSLEGDFRGRKVRSTFARGERVRRRVAGTGSRRSSPRASRPRG